MHDVPYFDRFAGVYDLAMPSADRADIEAGFAHAERPVELVLDVGGGSGRVARALDQHAVVADASRGMLAEARDHGLPTLQTDAGRLAVRDSSVDAVTIVDALHHFPDWDAAVAEASRVLRPGGVLVVRDFHPATVRGRLLVAVEHLVSFESSFDTPDELAAGVAAAGLDARVLERGFTYTVVGVEPGDG
ncbi:class I SAM-dependent methyltransferase [Halobacterium wangiae]|uniref:class I SAM-dependent methyltransferase n=1 Tax=Halobacterium wangiae TaxID=2902623 RepID=UPI001E375DB3|nr:methyltransferase domain-containing protein [Halobacterium wangiae]